MGDLFVFNIGGNNYRLLAAGQGTISAILSGTRGISKQLAAKLAARFGVPIAVFV